MSKITNITPEEKVILWSDRTRILGMPISFTCYSVDKERLYVKKGFFSTEFDEILLYRILDIKTKQSLWQKIFGVGTLILYSADQTTRELLLKNVKQPRKLHVFLSDLIEKTRLAKGVAGREIVGMAAAGHPHFDGDHDDVPHDPIPFHDVPDLPDD